PPYFKCADGRAARHGRRRVFPLPAGARNDLHAVDTDHAHAGVAFGLHARLLLLAVVGLGLRLGHDLAVFAVGGLAANLDAMADVLFQIVALADEQVAVADVAGDVGQHETVGGFRDATLRLDLLALLDVDFGLAGDFGLLSRKGRGGQRGDG